MNSAAFIDMLAPQTPQHFSKANSVMFDNILQTNRININLKKLTPIKNY